MLFKDFRKIEDIIGGKPRKVEVDWLDCYEVLETITIGIVTGQGEVAHVQDLTIDQAERLAKDLGESIERAKDWRAKTDAGALRHQIQSDAGMLTFFADLYRM